MVGFFTIGVSLPAMRYCSQPHFSFSFSIFHFSRALFCVGGHRLVRRMLMASSARNMFYNPARCSTVVHGFSGCSC